MVVEAKCGDYVTDLQVNGFRSDSKFILKSAPWIDGEYYYKGIKRTIGCELVI
jgi:hypothetical protein